jgi:hypothetical protein
MSVIKNAVIEDTPIRGKTFSEKHIDLCNAGFYFLHKYTYARLKLTVRNIAYNITIHQN